MYVRPKLTFVSFFMFFFAPSPKHHLNVTCVWTSEESVEDARGLSFFISYFFSFLFCQHHFTAILLTLAINKTTVAFTSTSPLPFKRIILRTC